MYRNSPAWLLDCITTPTKSTAKFEQAQSIGWPTFGDCGSEFAGMLAEFDINT